MTRPCPSTDAAGVLSTGGELTATGLVASPARRGFSAHGWAKLDPVEGRPWLSLTLRWGSGQLQRRGIEQATVSLDIVGVRHAYLSVDLDDAWHSGPLKLDGDALRALLSGDRPEDLLPTQLLASPVPRSLGPVTLAALAAGLEAALAQVEPQWAELVTRYAATTVLAGRG